MVTGRSPSQGRAKLVLARLLFCVRSTWMSNAIYLDAKRVLFCQRQGASPPFFDVVLRRDRTARAVPLTACVVLLAAGRDQVTSIRR